MLLPENWTAENIGEQCCPWCAGEELLVELLEQRLYIMHTGGDWHLADDQRAQWLKAVRCAGCDQLLLDRSYPETLDQG